jgi:hypothetical protein
MREKKESETEEPVRRLATSDGTWDIMREEKESETEEPVRRLATSRESDERVQETQLTLSG